MHLDRRRALIAGAVVAAAGCAGLRGEGQTGFAAPDKLVPYDVSAARLTRITVCTRPFRPSGPRLEAEKIGARTVIHNYGHGGSGWSLSWGCAEEAARLALSTGARRFAVLGAGVIGMTTALRLVETGAAVTIYAKEFPAETRSARATGVWSPASRIGLADAVDDAFAARWERWAGAAYAVHQHYVGSLGEPVEYENQYGIADEGAAEGPAATHQFLHWTPAIRALTPRWVDYPKGTHPFGARRVRGGQAMVFNVASYAERLTRDFLLRGGRMERRDFADRAAVLALAEPVIVNCAGYGARALWEDQSIVPVRGQINWLEPQREARYGVQYDGVFAISRRDGLVVQMTGPNDDYGYGNESETADRDETERAMTTLARLFPSVDRRT